MKSKKPGHIDTHRQTNSESSPKSICVYVTRRSNCRWPPKCSPLHLFYQTDTLYKSRTHLFKREPITNRAEPDSPKVPFPRPIQIYQHNNLLSIRQKHVDGFCRQRNCSPGFYYLASSALSSIYTTWQAMHTCMIWYLASRACTYRFCKLASSVRMAVYNFASSVQIRTCANFCTGSLGTHPKPRDHTSCELRVFAKRCRHPYAIFQKCSSRSFMKTTFSFLQSSLFLLFCFIFSLWKTKQPLPPHLLNLWPKKT